MANESQVGKKFSSTLGERGYLQALAEKQATFNAQLQAVNAEIEKLALEVCARCGLKPKTVLTLEGTDWLVKAEPADATPAPAVPAPPPPTATP